jgi:hypothetical protein
MSIDFLDTKIIVRRVGVGAAPFTWEVVDANHGFPLHVSSERFRSMEAAYNAGQDRLVEFLPGPRVDREEWRPAVRGASAAAIDWHADEADEIGVDDDMEADGGTGPGQSATPGRPGNGQD